LPRRRTLYRALAGYLFILPALVLFVAFHVYPTLQVFYLSTLEWNLISPTRKFVALDNFQAVLRNPEFWRSLLNTAYFTLNVPLGMAVALLIAVALYRVRTGRIVLRAMYFVPAITGLVPVSMVFTWLYNPDFGLLNYILRRIGLPPLGWLDNTTTAMPSIILLTIWHSVGNKMVIYLAGLTSIPAEYYEAATVDGASAWQRLRHITWPLLMPVTLFLLITSIISSFQVFSSIYIMTQGGPLGCTTTVAYIIYEYAFQFFKIGPASAMAVVLLAILALLSAVQLRIGRSRTTYLG
jgi:multiple sugar transport system permease protein